jgi:hypothetical protein
MKKSDHQIVIGLGHDGFRAICSCGWQSAVNWSRVSVSQAGSVHQRRSQLESVP